VRKCRLQNTGGIIINENDYGSVSQKTARTPHKITKETRVTARKLERETRETRPSATHGAYSVTIKYLLRKMQCTFRDHINSIVSRGHVRAMQIWRCFLCKDVENLIRVLCTTNAWVLQSSVVPSICKSYQSTWVCSTAIHKTSTTTPFTYLRRALCQIGNKPFGIATPTADLTLCYKIIHGLVLLSCDRFFTIVYDHTTRGLIESKL